ncbi:grasp-with-spasm system ATP-grasp peptide maturase [Chryseobacterium terrae]|uniref:Grasp-with-spasm system ATP-grasp peptide maturase n=1 Tax=Chryseobacterium terrae TaxID=3163299 RepID=A0ABW8Y5Z7_9FLAO
MILIFSEISDSTTLKVCEFLESLSISHLVIFRSDNLQFNDDSIIVGQDQYHLNEIKSVWFRRGKFYLNTDFYEEKDLNLYLRENDLIIEEYVNFRLDNLNKIGSSQGIHVNKLIVLEKAKLYNLLVPKFYLLKNFCMHDRKYISKGVNGNTYFDFDQHRFILPVQEIEGEHQSGLSFYQEYIDKKYELRIFYLHGKIWTMAIFSQNDEQTKTDFRNYNSKKPNRTVPYSLPKNIEESIDKLMRDLLLNTGSIDMIVTPENKYVFLEVNPVGQFGMVSLPCNYNLEKHVVDHLIY